MSSFCAVVVKRVIVVGNRCHGRAEILWKDDGDEAQKLPVGMHHSLRGEDDKRNVFRHHTDLTEMKNQL